MQAKAKSSQCGRMSQIFLYVMSAFCPFEGSQLMKLVGKNLTRSKVRTHVSRRCVTQVVIHSRARGCQRLFYAEIVGKDLASSKVSTQEKEMVSLFSCHQQLRVWIPEIQLHDEHSLLRMRCHETRDDKWSSRIQMSIQKSKVMTAKGCH